jgi:hypothetical protein
MKNRSLSYPGGLLVDLGNPKKTMAVVVLKFGQGGASRAHALRAVLLLVDEAAGSCARIVRFFSRRGRTVHIP